MRRPLLALAPIAAALTLSSCVFLAPQPAPGPTQPGPTQPAPTTPAPTDSGFTPAFSEAIDAKELRDVIAKPEPYYSGNQRVAVLGQVRQTLTDGPDPQECFIIVEVGGYPEPGKDLPSTLDLTDLVLVVPEGAGAGKAKDCDALEEFYKGNQAEFLLQPWHIETLTFGDDSEEPAAVLELIDSAPL